MPSYLFLSAVLQSVSHACRSSWSPAYWPVHTTRVHGRKLRTPGTPRLVSGINFLVLSVNQPLCLCPSCSCSYHFFSLCQLTTLTIHNSLSLSLPAQDLSLSQIFSPKYSLPASGLTPRTSRLDRFFWASPIYVFSFFIILFCLVPCGRLSWLLVSFWAHVNIVHHIISYHIISYHIIKEIHKILVQLLCNSNRAWSFMFAWALQQWLCCWP